MEALANGNSVLANPPPSGVLITTPTSAGGGTLRTSANALATTYVPNYRYVITTTTGQIAHGTNGDNTDPNPQPLMTGAKVTDGQNVLGVPTGANYGNYLLNIADRSMLGAVSTTGINVSMQHARARLE